MSRAQGTADTRCWQGGGAGDLSLVAGGVASGTDTLEDSLAVPPKTKHTLSL